MENTIEIQEATRYTDSGELGFGFFRDGERILLTAVKQSSLGYCGRGTYWVPSREEAERLMRQQNSHDKSFQIFHTEHLNAL